MGKSERAAAVAAATEEMGKSIEAKTASATALAEAKAAVRGGKTAVSEAQKMIDNYLTDMKKIFDRCDAKCAELDAFKAGPLATFEELKDKETPSESQTADSEPPPIQE